MGLFNNDMTGLAAAYASMNDEKYLLTNADKVGNTPAWQNRYRVNESTGEMLYEMADHLKESYEQELIAQLDETLAELVRLDEGKMPAGLQAYIDKKKGGKKEKEENGDDNGKSSKGSKPDFLDLDKDGDKKEPMKKAAKEKKEETEYNYVNTYLEKVMGADTTMRMMAAKDRMKGKDKLLSKKDGDKNAAYMKAKIKMSPRYAGAMGEELINSGVFTEEEITKFIWLEFDEGYQRNPEKDPEYNKDNETFAQKRKRRMNDPKTGINSPAFKKFMADKDKGSSAKTKAKRDKMVKKESFSDWRSEFVWEDGDSVKKI